MKLIEKWAHICAHTRIPVNTKSPLPNKNSWALYQVPNSTFMRAISVLQMQGTGMDVWCRLPEQKKNTIRPGSSIVNLWGVDPALAPETTGFTTKSAPSQGLPQESSMEHVASNVRLQLEQSLRRSWPLASTVKHILIECDSIHVPHNNAGLISPS